jgi:hypothetical protein
VLVTIGAVALAAGDPDLIQGPEDRQETRVIAAYASSDREMIPTASADTMDARGPKGK